MFYPNNWVQTVQCAFGPREALRHGGFSVSLLSSPTFTKPFGFPPF